MKESFELRSPLGSIEDDNTCFSFTDWTSAMKMKNYLNPLLRIDIGVLRNLTEEVNEIKGYQLTVYDVNTQATIYKVYINYIEDGVYSLTTEEAINFLNQIGFRCKYDEVVELTERARTILESCKNMGYTHINRVLNTADYLLTTADTVAQAEVVVGKPLRDIFAKTYKNLNLYDFRFIGTIPMSIKEILN